MPEPVVLRGFLLSVSCPSESHLEVSYDTTRLGWDRYRQVIYGLSDLLAEIDEEYKLRRLRGRGIQARHRRLVDPDGQVRRVKVLRFSPYPSRYSNHLTSLRTRLYMEVNRRCVPLQYSQSGYYKEVLYLLPYSEAPNLLEEVEMMNMEIRGLREEVERFKETKYAEMITELLRKAYGEELNPYAMVREIPEIRLRLTPIQVEPHILEEYVDERVLRQLELQRRELAERAIEHFRTKLTNLINELLAVRRAEEFKEMATQLRELRRIAEDVGLRSLAETVIAPLEAIAEEPNRIEEIAQKAFQVSAEKLNEGIDYRVRALLQAL